MPGGDIGGWPGCDAPAGAPALTGTSPVAALRSAEQATGRMGRIRASATRRRIMARRPSTRCRRSRGNRRRRSHAGKAAGPASPVTSHSHAMPRPCPAPRPAPSRLARHARPGASRHGRARSETRPPPGQSGFAPRRRQPPVAIHSRHFRMDAGRAKAAPPTRRPGAWRVDPRRRRPARPRRHHRRRRDGCGRSATAPGGIAAPTAPPLPAAAGGGRLHAELVAKGVPILSGPTDLTGWRHRTPFFRDPRGQHHRHRRGVPTPGLRACGAHPPPTGLLPTRMDTRRRGSSARLRRAGAADPCRRKGVRPCC